MREKNLDFGTVEKLLDKVPGLTSLRTMSPIFKISITKETCPPTQNRTKNSPKLKEQIKQKSQNNDETEPRMVANAWNRSPGKMETGRQIPEDHRSGSLAHL